MHEEDGTIGEGIRAMMIENGKDWEKEREMELRVKHLLPVS